MTTNCPIPIAELSISLNNDIVTCNITTSPGENETITNSTLFIFDGTKYVQITDVNLIGITKTEIFEQNIISGSYYYIYLLLTNSCNESSGWLISNIICDNVCIGYNLYSQRFVGTYDAVTGTWSEGAGCVIDQLLEYNSLDCEYIEPEPPDEPSNIIFYGIIGLAALIGLKLLSKK